MALTYNDFVRTIANITALAPYDSTEALPSEFVQILPRAIEYAEDRIYREIDLLNTVYVNDTGFLQKNNRNFTLPAAPYGNFLTVQGINVLYGTPVQRIQLQPVSIAFLNAVWGSQTNASTPQYFSMVQQDNMIVGPWPDQIYGVEVIGTFQPEPLSEKNSTTQITVLMPDLFIAAAMVFMSGWMRDFGSQSDNPQQSQSWENQYQTLFKSANLLELRKKFAGPGWTSLSSMPISPTR